MNNIPYDDQKFLEYVKAKRKKRQCLRCNPTFLDFFIKFNPSFPV